jgi:hypothetical protein
MIFYLIKRKIKQTHNIIKLLYFIYKGNDNGAYTMLDNIING